MDLRQAAQQALEALEKALTAFGPGLTLQQNAITALRAALAEPDYWQEEARRYAGNADYWRKRYKALAEPEQEMSSDTRYTVAVEGQAPTYWDCIHDAMTNAQRAVYSGVDNTTRAIDDLKAGRIAEWSYGFSAVRIYPPQRKAAPTPQPEQEPVAWMVYAEGGASAYVTDSPNDLIGAYRALPLYTAPPQRKPLTDAEILSVLRLTPPAPSLWPHLKGEAVVGDVQKAVLAIARAIEHAHGIGEQHGS